MKLIERYSRLAVILSSHIDELVSLVSQDMTITPDEAAAVIALVKPPRQVYILTAINWGVADDSNRQDLGEDVLNAGVPYATEAAAMKSAEADLMQQCKDELAESPGEIGEYTLALTWEGVDQEKRAHATLPMGDQMTYVIRALQVLE